MADPYRVGGNYNGVKTKDEQRKEWHRGVREAAWKGVKAVLGSQTLADKIGQGASEIGNMLYPTAATIQNQGEGMQPDAPDMGGVHGPETKPEAKVAPTATQSSSVDAYLSGNYPKAGVEQGKHDANLGIKSLDDYAASRGMSAEIGQPRKRGMSR